MITRIPLKLALTLEPEVLLEYERLLGLAEGPQKGVYARVPSEDYNRSALATISPAARNLNIAAVSVRAMSLCTGTTPRRLTPHERKFFRTQT